MLKDKLSWLKEHKIRCVIIFFSVILLVLIGLTAKYFYDRYSQESKMLAKYTLLYEGDKNNIKKTEEQKENFSIGVSGIPSDKELYIHDTEAGRSSIKLIYQPLIEIGTNMKITYKIADNIEFSDGGNNATVSLKDIKFSDGKAVTSEDIKNSYMHLCSPSSEYYGKNKMSVIDGISEYSGGLSKNIKGIECVDENTVKFSFKENSALNIMSLTLPIIRTDENNIYPLGTGPYQISKIIYMSNIDLVTNKYCDENPYEYKNIYLKTIPLDTLKRDISDFNLDMFYTNSGDILDIIKDSNYHNIYKTRNEDYYYLGFNLGSKKSADINLRKAVSHSFDREALAEEFYGYDDKTIPLGITSVDKAKKNFTTEISFDIDDAKDYLDDASSSNLSFICQNDSNSCEYYEYIKSILKNADINLDAEKLDEDDYNNRMKELASGTAAGDVYISKLNGLNPVELIENTIKFDTELKNEYTDMLCEAYQKAPEDLFENVEEFCYDKALLIPIVTSYNYIAVSSDCDNDLMMELFY